MYESILFFSFRINTSFCSWYDAHNYNRKIQKYVSFLSDFYLTFIIFGLNVKCRYHNTKRICPLILQALIIFYYENICKPYQTIIIIILNLVQYFRINLYRQRKYHVIKLLNDLWHQFFQQHTDTSHIRSLLRSMSFSFFVVSLQDVNYHIYLHKSVSWFVMFFSLLRLFPVLRVLFQDFYFSWQITHHCTSQHSCIFASVILWLVHLAKM